MEESKGTPKLYNPFGGKVGGRGAIYRGFFRIMPLQRWPPGHITGVFEYIACHPALFGFPDAPLAIVNPAYFLPGIRNRSSGVMVFGHERGCRTIVIPGSCNAEPYDALDAKLIEPLFKWNPGATTIYLSYEAQGMYRELVPILTRMRSIRGLTLEGWDDPVAIHKVLMACRQVELVDCFSLEDTPRDWKNERGVQALSSLIEMHPKLRGVCATRNFLLDWFQATEYSRCKHNIALIPFGCDYVLLWYSLWAGGVLIACFIVANLVHQHGLLMLDLTDRTRWIIWFSLLVGLFGSCVGADIILTPKLGKGWTRIAKYYILAKRVLELFIRRYGKNTLVKK